MIDIAINNSGDFIFNRDFSFHKLELSWNYGKNEALKLSFKAGRNMLDPPEKDGLKLSFNTNIKQKKKICIAAHDMDELRQRVLILLRTELGELKAEPGFGTEIVKQKHKDIMDEEVLSVLHDIVLDAASVYLKDPSVIIKKMKNDSAFSCQNLNVYIYDGKKEIYEFELEGH